MSAARVDVQVLHAAVERVADPDGPLYADYGDVQGLGVDRRGALWVRTSALEWERHEPGTWVSYRYAVSTEARPFLAVSPWLDAPV